MNVKHCAAGDRGGGQRQISIRKYFLPPNYISLFYEEFFDECHIPTYEADD